MSALVGMFRGGAVPSRWSLGRLALCVGLLAPGAGPVLATTGVPVFAEPYRVSGAGAAKVPKATRMLADGSLLIATTDGFGVSSVRYDVTGALLSSATFYPPVKAIRKIAVDGFGTLAVIAQAATNNGDFWVMKYNGVTGNAFWPAPATYNQWGNSFEDPVDVAFDGSGNVVVAGSSWSSSGINSLATVKYSGATGSVIWGPTLMEIGSKGAAVALTVDPFGGVVVVGKSGSTTVDWVTVKYYGPTGGTIWSRYYSSAGSGDDVPVAVATDPYGHVIVTGSAVLAGDTAGTPSFATIKYERDAGTVVWGPVVYNQGYLYAEIPKALHVDSRGDVFVTGSISGSGSDFGTFKYSRDTGAVLWGPVRLDGPSHGNDSPVAIAADGAGRVWLTGTSGNTVSDDVVTLAYSSATGDVVVGPTVYDGTAGGADAPSALVIDPQGDLFVTGTSTTSTFGTDLVTLKYGNSGNLLWGPIVFNGAAIISDRPVAVSSDAFGNVVLLMRSNNGRNDDFATVKVDGSTGGVLWGPVVFDAGDTDYPIGLALDGSGNVTVTGSSRNASGNYDYATLKYSGVTGAILWGPVLMDGGGSDWAVAIAVDPLGNPVVTGTAYWGATRREDLVTVKYDGSTGSVLWGPRALDVSSGYDAATALAIDAAGDVLVGGNAYVGNDQDMVVAKYVGATGVLAWWPVTLRGGSYRTEKLTALAPDSSGNVLVTGYSLSGFASDFASFKISASGSVLWGPVLYNSGSEEDFVRAAAVDAAGNLIVTGTTSQAGQGYNITTLKYAGTNGGVLWGPVHFNGPWTSNDEPAAMILDAAGNVVIAGYSFDPSRRSADATVVKYAGSTGTLIWEPALHDARRHDKVLALARLGSDVVVGIASLDGFPEGASASILVRYTESLGLVSLPADIPPARCGNAYDKPLVAANGSGTYFFSIASGSLPPGITLTSAGVLTGSPSALGSFVFRVRVEDGGASAERDFELNVYEGAGGVPISVTRNPVCAGATTTLSVPEGYESYAWHPDGGAAPSLTVSPVQPTTYGVVVTDSNGCTRSGSIVVRPLPNTLAQPAVTAGGPTRFCEGGSVTLTSTLATSYLWSTGATTRSITVSESGSYGVTVTDGAGCPASSVPTAVTVDPVPIATITAPDFVCAGSAGNAASVPDVFPDATYTWTITNGTITAGAGTPSVLFTAGTSGSVTIGVTVRSSALCTAAGSKAVVVSPLPSAEFSVEPNVCPGSSHTASVPDAGAGAAYAWTVNGGTIVSGAGTPQLTYVAGESGQVMVSLSVQAGTACSAGKEATSTITALPSAAITTGSPVCANATNVWASVPDAGPGATYTWTVTNGTIVPPAPTNRFLIFTPGASGTVDISVTVRTATGCTADGAISVPIAPPPSAAITAPAFVCLSSSGHVASVADAGQGATYTWTIAHGTITAGAGTPTITFSSSPSDDVALTVTVQTSTGCSAAETRIVTVRATPSGVIAAPASVCAGAAVTASISDAGGNATYTWTVLNGTITFGGGSTSNSVTFTAGASGIASVNVQVQNAAGCSASGSKTVAIDPPPSVAISAPFSVCANASGQTASVADAGAGATYTWTATNASITSGAGTRSISFTAGTTGPVILGVSVQNAAGCSASGSASIAVSAKPSVAIAAPAAVCASSAGNAASVPDAGVGATYSWTTTNASITSGAGTRSISFTAGTTGPVVLGVTVQNAAGCGASGSANIAVNAQPSAVIAAPAAVCASSAGNAASVPDAGAGATYSWTATNATITSGAGTRSISFTAGTTGPVILGVAVQNAAGCGASGAASISVSALPSAVIAAPAAVCASTTGNAASVPDAGAGATYSWTATNATITSGAGTRSISFTAGTAASVTLSVTVTGAPGCTVSGTRSVTVNAQPSATITAPATIKKSRNGTASVPSAGTGATYTWAISNGTITGGQGTRSLSFRAGTPGAMQLAVTVTKATGCAASGSRTVTVTN